MILRWTDSDGWSHEKDVSAGATVIGRSSSCDVVLREDKVSRQHARIDGTHDPLTIRDLGSRNGTRVNGAQIREQALSPGDRIDIGAVRLTLVDPATAKAAGVHRDATDMGAAARGDAQADGGVPPAHEPPAAEDPAAANARGLRLQATGDQVGAEAAFRKALGAGNRAAGFNLANVLAQRGASDEAHQVLEDLSVALSGVRPAGARTPSPRAQSSDAAAVPAAPFIAAQAVPAAPREIATAHHRKHRVKFWLGAGAGFIVCAALLVLGAYLLSPPSPCVRNCYVAPPKSPPLANTASYHSSQYGFSVAYDAKCCSPAKTTPTSVSWLLSNSQGSIAPVFYGVSARGLSADQLVTSGQSSHFPAFSFQYSIPDAELGYVLGAGALYSGQWTPLQGQIQNARVAIVAAIRNRVGVVMACEGSQVSEAGADHPDPSRLAGDQWCDQTLATVMWPGERPR